MHTILKHRKKAFKMCFKHNISLTIIFSFLPFVMVKSVHFVHHNSFLRSLHSSINPFFREEILEVEQKTLGRQIKFAGIGLHSGQSCEMTIKPAPADTGLVFRHTTRNWQTRAVWNRVVDNRLSTVLGDPSFLRGGVWRQRTPAEASPRTLCWW